MQKFQLQDYRLEPEGKIAKRMIYKDANVICFILNIASGASLPPHTHFDCTVLLQVLTGKASVNVDGNSLAAAEQDLIQLDGPEKMSVDNVGEETLALYVSISPAPPNDQYTKDANL
ncbi:cupin domain-containing protein [Dethiobacter alkaliphilus]|uniref:Cupin 2 conserved barrel domain protein n=1 Tax=Dethiobacter alkaliphilus AHT 1 TaxID=555088 RepID=C0GIF0_DETAL|nr:cupin [Dethiobacter alkaliphilus]EEG76811.1 conserved hypothetical protein [Dethiobacter alkaliphilus AHT 1]